MKKYAAEGEVEDITLTNANLIRQHAKDAKLVMCLLAQKPPISWEERCTYSYNDPAKHLPKNETSC